MLEFSSQSATKTGRCVRPGSCISDDPMTRDRLALEFWQEQQRGLPDYRERVELSNRLFVQKWQKAGTIFEINRK